MGAFALTRLLEKKLVASGPSRVVNVSRCEPASSPPIPCHSHLQWLNSTIPNPPISVTGRLVAIPDAKEFLFNWREGQYAHTKLAQVIFSSELHKRLQPLGVNSCAVDPGGVNSSIWDRGGMLSKPPIRNIIGALYAPPSDGASAVIHAASAPWTSQSPVGPTPDPLRPPALLGPFVAGFTRQRAKEDLSQAAAPGLCRWRNHLLHSSPRCSSWRLGCSFCLFETTGRSLFLCQGPVCFTLRHTQQGTALAQPRGTLARGIRF